MKEIKVYYSVQTLLGLGKSISQIARELEIDRKTARKIIGKVKSGEIEPPFIQRKSALDDHKEFLLESIQNKLSARLMHQKLLEEKSVLLSYSAVKKYVAKLRGPDFPYMPVITPPGQEAQVDFGYAGYFQKGSKKIKAWLFCMKLSSSRYAYYELVENQNITTFIQCHINAFEFFCGVPQVVSIDNLKSAVLKASFYEPSIQKEYAAFLAHYGCEPITCRPRTPTDKGKVESAIKYVKNNFLKGLDTRDFFEARKKLRHWMDNICNIRLHGTTRKIPKDEFYNTEKAYLKKLPSNRYEILDIQKRTANTYAHISYKYNFYSVPRDYIGQELTIKSNGSVLQIYDKHFKEVAIHQICTSQGEFITNPSHNPKLEHFLSRPSQYEQEMSEIGKDARDFFFSLKAKKPSSYQRITSGILQLSQTYGKNIINQSLKRANIYGIYNYLSIKKIIEEGLYNKESLIGASIAGGFANDLSIYDKLTGGLR